MKYILAKTLLSLSLTTAISCAVTPAYAKNNTVGIAAPLSGSFAPLGEQLVKGAKYAHPEQASLIIVDDTCTAEGGIKAADTFVAEQVKIVVGFLCSESLEAALPILKKAQIPLISSGVSELTLTEKRDTIFYPVFRMSTGMDKEVAAIGTTLGSLWKEEPFAIIDDGTIEGRELAAGVKTALKDQQLTPVFTDTYRPGLNNQNALVSRLRRAGATHVFIGGQADDAAAIAQSAKSLSYPLIITGGALFNSPTNGISLSTDTFMMRPVSPEALASAQSFKQDMLQKDEIVEPYLATGYASMQVADQAQKLADEKLIPLAEVLTTSAFETILGTIRFNANGMRSDNPNRLHRFNGEIFAPVGN